MIVRLCGACASASSTSARDCRHRDQRSARRAAAPEARWRSLARAQSTFARRPTPAALSRPPNVAPFARRAWLAPTSSSASPTARDRAATERHVVREATRDDGASCGTHANGRSHGPTPAGSDRRPVAHGSDRGSSSPRSARKRVVFPAPVGPTMATISPTRAVKEVSAPPLSTPKPSHEQRAGEPKTRASSPNNFGSRRRLSERLEHAPEPASHDPMPSARRRDRAAVGRP